MKRKYVLILDTIILILSIIGFYTIINKADIAAEFVNIEGKIVVKKIQNTLLKEKLKEHDQIITINGHSISSIDDIEYICSSYKIGSNVTIQIKRKNRKHTKNILLVSFYSTFYLIINFSTGILYFFLAIIVLLKSTKEEAFVFHWIAICASIITLATWGMHTLLPSGLNKTILILFSTAYVFLPCVFVHFSFIFPKNKWPKFKKLKRIVYGYAIIISIWVMISIVFVTNHISVSWFHQYLLIFDINRWVFAACMFFGVANFFHSYKTALEEAERRKLRWIILGMTIGPLSFVLLWQVPQLLTSYGLIPESIVQLIAAIAPITFAIAIVRHQIMDIDLLFKRSTVYLIVITTVMLLYTGMVVLLVIIIGRVTVKTSMIISAIAAIIIAFLFEPARKFVQQYIDKTFFRVQYNYRIAQQNMLKEINKAVDSNSLAQIVVSQMDRLLNLERISFIVQNFFSKKWQMIVDKNHAAFSSKIMQTLKKLTKKNPYSVFGYESYIEKEGDYKKIKTNNILHSGIMLVIVLKTKDGKPIAYILLGNKKSQLRFSLEDIDLFKFISTHIGLTLEKINLQQKLLLQYEETRRLNELNQLKSNFVSSVSHELQTPLTSIKMFTELLRTKKKLPAHDQKEYLTIIEQESNRLSRLIKNVLDFSKMEQGIKKYQLSKVNLIEIIKTVVKIMKHQLDYYGFKIKIDLSLKKILLMADKDALIEAFTNIIANAIKYSEDEKSIAITSEIEGKYAVINISDRGIGIDKIEQSHIFKRFYRSSNEKIQNIGGAGLGLALVKNIIDGHHGKITINSTLKKGSTFSLYLPMESSNAKTLNS